jgi:Lon protease-like protein
MSEELDMTLPKPLRIVSVRGAVLMPKSQIILPVNDIEHLQMVKDAIEEDMFVGLAQPASTNDESELLPSLFNIGTLARITELSKVEEGRFMVTFKGICRFEILKEIRTDNLYRMFEVDYDRYLNDLNKEEETIDNDLIDRPRLLKALRSYFKTFDLSPNWQEINSTPNEKLIAALAMVCPFHDLEKQALLEPPTIEEQSKIMTTLIEIASFAGPNDLCIMH